MAQLTTWEKKHKANIAGYERKIDTLYKDVIKEAVKLSHTVGALDEDSIFSFDKHPSLRPRVDKLFKEMNDSMFGIIANGVRSEWTLSNNKNDELARAVFGNNVGRLTQAQYRKYFSNNDAAREAFIQRKENGLKLSDRVWQYTNQFKNEIELGLDVGIRNGLSADAMSRDLRMWLKNPDDLFRRVRDEHGNLQLSKRAAAYHTGRGVFRSSYKNARRLAATETNIAYRTSDFERWQQLDFVVGIEIHLSNNHTLINSKGIPEPFTDICDKLQGRYPKTFKFTGWHPHCRCFATSILKTDEEMKRDRERMLRGEEPLQDSVNTVKDVPEEFRQWVEENKERAKGWGSMPYFIRQNPQYVSGFEVDTYTPAERKFTRALSTSPAMKESLGIFLQARYPNIPNTEKAAIFHFTRGDISAYRQLNNQLRKGNLSEFNQAFSQLISQGLSKIEPVEQTVYRTVRLNKTNLATFIDNARSGKTTTFAGFTSTTTERSIAEHRIESLATIKKNETDVLLVINGKSGHPIEELSQFSGRFEGLINQHEILFDKGCKFRFDGVLIKAGEMPVFYLTEV
ncbi:MAG: ADP-ribosyltransferase domain-containing protein [Bacteroidaceae bacterium]|nr:ADP-ribosyltransferase domain-containing protein [Bacteroidaceae bacterium]